jgi:hypothetical protein
MYAADVAPMDEYLTALERQLAGPTRLRADLLREARDSLTDAIEAYTENGLDPQVAQARAVAEFGTVDELAPAYRAELAAGAARRLAARVAVTLPAIHVASYLMWWRAPWKGVPPSATYLMLADAIDWLSYLAAAAALLGLVALRWTAGRPRPDHLARGGRQPLIGRVLSGRPFSGPVLARVVGIGALVALGLFWTGSAVIYAMTVRQWGDALTWPPMIVGGVVMATTYTGLGWSARHCLTSY